MAHSAAVALAPSQAGSPDTTALRRIVVCATIAMLVAIAVMRRSRLPSDEVVARAGRIEAAAKSTLPLREGEWTGEEIAIPPAAVRLLRPTATLSRRYRDGS